MYEHALRYVSGSRTEIELCQILDEMKNAQGFDLVSISVVTRQPRIAGAQQEAAWMCVFRREKPDPSRN